MSSLPQTQLRLQFLVAILSLSAFALLGVPRVEAINNDRVKIQVVDTHCTATPGTARGNPQGDNVWSSWATDQDAWDPDCVRVWIDSAIEQQKDIRFCIQTSDGSLGANLSNSACTPWASQGGGWSAWAADPDKWAYDGIRIKIDTQDLPGRYISNYRLGVQNSRATGDNCSQGVGTSGYTTGMNGGGGWSDWAPDALSEGSIACTRINFDNVNIVGMPCNINGNIVGSGGSVLAYAAPSVPYGSGCAAEWRTCTNGAASGSYGYNSCYVNAQTPPPTGVGAYCTNGNITMYWNGGAEAYFPRIANLASCPGWAQSGSTCYVDWYGATSAGISAPTNASYSFWVHGWTSAGGMSNPTSVGVTCSALNCTFNGNTVTHGSSVTAYAAPSVPYGSTCSSQSRTCSNGSLSGSYAYSSCSVAAPSNCTFNGSPVNHGSSVTAYSTNSVPYGSLCSSVSQTRTCTNGTLSGSYTNSTCTVAAPSNCTLNGVTVPHGTSYTFYDRTPLPYGTACGAGNSAYAQSRTCTNGTLSGNGTFLYGTCSVDASQQPVTLTGNGFIGSATVRSGAFVRLQWNGVNADSCSLTGSGGFVSTSTPTVPMTAGAVVGSTWVQVNTKTTFTVTCSKSSPASSSTQSATINMVPQVVEQ